VTRHPDGDRLRLYRSVAREIQSHREAAGLSVPVVAKRIGVSTTQLSKIEEGIACPLHVLVALADVFDCTLDDLVPVLVEARAVA
jgi:transcriptional regulator with XRE-family HTH domain